jgi:hypothetical protein
MRPTRRILWALLLAMPFLILNAGNTFAEDFVPEVTARVARISFLSGDVQIKRADSKDWERAANNLPIVEGDEIATDSNARLEIQFNSENYLRLSENAYLKITTLRDEGIAVSLPNGSMSLRVLSFDKERAYFEIDAPQTTVSVEKAGMYRIDAGGKSAAEVRITVTDNGQARVYSENSGFTLKNGRSATVQLDGNYAGEWETSDASKYADEFDSWALKRDAVIAKRLRDSYYDKYYDRDIYGAEDLNEYGEWVYTRKYGYVWKPYRTSVSIYADWSPYRYGHWRWIPPYGWTWVNDEPWGWATYHHGRWVWDDGYWYWSPYPQTRGRRSWWRPALVIISYIGKSICWYPLPYHYGYYNYNSYYYNDRRRYNTTVINNNTTTIIVNPTPTPTPPFDPAGSVITSGNVNPKIQPPFGSVPPVGVVTVDDGNFGSIKGNIRTAPLNLANTVLSQAPTENTSVPALPTIRDLNGKLSKEIVAETPRNIITAAQIKTGATERTSGLSMGENLRKERILGNRPPVEKTPAAENNGESQTLIRNTGAVKRQPRSEILPNAETPSSPETPVKTPRNKVRENNTINTAGSENENPPTKPRRDNNVRVAPPFENPRPQPEEQPVKPPRRERQEPIRQEPPREAPPRIQPPRGASPRQEPPKPEQQPDQKPAVPNDEGKVNRKIKDGR